jgi:hypothetical protein
MLHFSHNILRTQNISVAESHHFYAAPAPGKNFDAAPAPAPTQGAELSGYFSYRG